MFSGLFFRVLNPLTLGDHNFLNSISVLMIFSVLIGGVQVLYGHKKNNGALPLQACPERLNVQSPTN
jgi:hypothetical protein